MLERTYEDGDEQRERYGNGMAAAHLAALERAADERVVEWTDEADLRAAVDEVP